MAKGKGFQSVPKIAGRKQDMEAVSKNLEILTGMSGNGLKRAVLMEDLVGLATLGLRYQNGAIEEDGTTPGGGTVNPITPPQPTNVTAQGAFTNIIVQWDIPNFPGFAYAEVWRSGTDDFGTAVLIGTTRSSIYADPAGYAATYYYWVRFVSTTDDTGPLNATAGTVASTAVDVRAVIDQLSDEIGTTLDYLDAQWSVKTDVDNLVGGVGFFNDGISTKFAIDADVFTVLDQTGDGVNPFIVTGGITYLNTAMVADASIQVAQIEQLTVDDISGFSSNFVLSTIGTGNITNAYIGDYIQSNNYAPGSTGWIIHKNGSAEFNGDVLADYIQAGDVNVIGTLMVQGDAITVPRSSYTAADLTVGTATVIQSVTITCSGQPIHIQASCTIKSGAYDGGVRFGLYRVGAPTNLMYDTNLKGGTRIWAQREEKICFAVGDDPGAGTHTYELIAMLHGGSDMVAAYRSITCVEYKR